MRVGATAAALAASASTASAAVAGFNYGSTFTTGAAKQQSDFEAEFKAAQALPGVSVGFTSARLYTMVQAGTQNTPISAIPAALNTKTSLLLTLWSSAGDAVFANELQALKSAISQYGSQLAGSTIGISVGSEDLYRNSPTGILNKENPGVDPTVIVNYIGQVRQALSGTALSGVPVGHVDTWTAWVNGSNSAVVTNSDFLGFDGYPYFQNTQANAIENNAQLFRDSFAATQAASQGKPVWVTETGYPVSGKTSGQAVPSPQNARTYWSQVGCSLFGTTNTWWYTLWDADPDTPNPSFGIINSLGAQPNYDLSCSDVSSSSSSSSSSATSTSSGSSGSTTSGGVTGASTTSAGSSSSSGSSTSSASTSSITPVQNGGSPGITTGLGSSQLSLETVTSTGLSSVPTGFANSTSSSSGTSPSSNVSTTSSKPSTTPSSITSGAATLASGSVALFLAAAAVLFL